MTTTTQLMHWCTDHGYQLPTPSKHWSFNMTELKWVGIAILVAAAYGIGRIGLSQTWTDVTNVFSTIKGWFSASKATTTSTASTTTVA